MNQTNCTVSLTIFTPSYNRAHTLSRTYQSLQRQDCKDFIWLIVDDGSTDGTGELVRKWQAEEESFEIRYIYKENGGMHTAHNTAYRSIDTELNICIDSDDMLAPGAVSLILDTWETRDKNDLTIAGIIGLDTDYSGNVIGDRLPVDKKYTTLSGYYAAGGIGDKKLVYRTDIMKAIPEYPVFEGEKYVSLAYKYHICDQNYKLIIINQPLCLVEYQANGSTGTMFQQYLDNPKGFAFVRKEDMKNPTSLKRLIMTGIHYCSSSFIAGNKQYVKESPRKLLTVLCSPAGVVLTRYIKHRANKNRRRSSRINVIQETEPPIRVLNLFTIMDRGGAETMVMNYYRNLDRTKIQFDFMVHRPQRGAYDDEIEGLGGRIYRMPPIYPQNFARYKKDLAQFFADHKEYKIIHAHMSELGYFAFCEAEKKGVPIRICHAHNAPRGWDYKMPVRQVFKKKMMNHLTHFMACGTESAEWLFGKNSMDQVVYLRNAIDTEKFRWSNERAEELRQAMRLQDKLIIGHVGRFAQQKNHSFLIDVFKEIMKIRQDAVLVLIGEGDQKKAIEKKVGDLGLQSSVRFLGSRDDVNDWLQVFDVFVLPSKFEGLPVSLIEAQTAGCLCMISSEQPEEAIVTDNVFRLSLKRSPEDWAALICRKAEYFKRSDTAEVVKRAGFDIVENARWLQEFYLTCYDEGVED